MSNETTPLRGSVAPQGTTYILENTEEGRSKYSRYYVGFTRSLPRRLAEHAKHPKRKSYNLVWQCRGNYEYKIKRWGATRFMEIIRSGIL